MTKGQLKRLDAQLDHWQATDKAHKAKVAYLEETHKHDLDWFDHVAYQKMIYGNGWNR